MPIKSTNYHLEEKLSAFGEKELGADLTKKASYFERDRGQNYLDIVQVIVVALDATGKITLMNQMGCRIFGCDESELIGKDWFATCLPQPEGREKVFPYFRKLMTKEASLEESFENPIITRRGELRYIAWQNTLLKNEKGDIVGTLSAGEDITERRTAEQALRESEERYRRLFQNLTSGFALHEVMIDEEGKPYDYRFLDANPAFEKVTGLKKNSIIGRTALEVFPSLKRGWIKRCGQVAITQEPTNFETYISTLDRYFGVSIYCPKPFQFAIIFEDITQRKLAAKEKKKLERQLWQAHKLEALGTLAGGIAHDFNNLLMSIQGRVSLLGFDLSPEDPCLAHVRAIEGYVRNAANLTRQLLGVARRGKYEVKPFDINQVVSSSAEMFERAKKEIRIHTKLESSPLIVEADQGQVEQVLLNMYINSWQAMPSGGELYLESKSIEVDDAYGDLHQIDSGDFVMISVTDTGCGMDEETRRRVFDPFFTTREKSRGTGLGLASAYGIIKNHGGTISVYSELGHGTTFNIYLPVSCKTAPRDFSKGKMVLEGSEHILLVDDETIILEVGRSMLARMGYDVAVANGGEEAIRILSEKGDSIDLVILDLIMPVMDGAATFDRIRKLYPQVPVLLSSGYAVSGQAEALLGKGCNGFIQKPYNIMELSHKVRTILDEKKFKQDCLLQVMDQMITCP